MDITEFTNRTKKFMPAEQIERYAEDFEPAYMEAGDVDKDDFCAMLRDEGVRRFVACISHALNKQGETIARLCRKSNEATAAHEVESRKAYEAIRHASEAIRLISTTCDRALARIG